MYDYRLEELDDRTIRATIEKSNELLSYSLVVSLLSNDPKFQLFFTKLHRSISFNAYKWEAPEVSSSTIDQPFECVFINSPSLDRKPDPRSFLEQFQRSKPEERVISFSNLGGDAFMVVPKPDHVEKVGCHIGSFMKGAPDDLCMELWKNVGETTLKNISEKPVWLSTAGGGVPWLHVRLDSRPKYYGYLPYKDNG